MRLITLTWVSWSWKSSIRDYLVENYEWFCKTTDATTRQPRADTELDEYVFYTPRQMLDSKKRWAFIEFLEYWGEMYAILNNLKTLGSDNIVAVVLPEWVKQLREYAKTQEDLEVISIKLNIQTRTQRNRLIARGDSIKDIERRLGDWIFIRASRLKYDLEIDCDEANIREIAEYIINKIK